MEQKVSVSEYKIAILEKEVQDLKKSAEHPDQDDPNLKSMLKDINTSLVLFGGGKLQAFETEKLTFLVSIFRLV